MSDEWEKNAESTRRWEQEVRQLLDNGDVALAVAQVIERYGRELYGFIVNCLSTIPDADDVFGSVCEGICAGIENFNWHSSMRTWLYSITRHILSHHLSSTQTRKKRFISLAEAPEVYKAVQSVRTVTRSYLKTDVKRRAAALREKLPLTDQLLLDLRIDRNLSWREIATVMADTELPPEALNRAEQNVRKQFQRAKQRFKDIAKKEGLL